jgi:hypothetical protein
VNHYEDKPAGDVNEPRSRNPRGRLQDDVVYRKVPISQIDIDLQHPSLSSEEAMERHIRCVERIAGTLSVIPHIVQPILLAERDDAEGRYWLVDGWGRIDVAKDHLHTNEMDAMILPAIPQSERVKIRLHVNTPRAA